MKSSRSLLFAMFLLFCKALILPSQGADVAPSVIVDANRPIVLRSTDTIEKYLGSEFEDIAKVELGYWQAADWRAALRFVAPNDPMQTNANFPDTYSEWMKNGRQAGIVFWNVIKCADGKGRYYLAQVSRFGGGLEKTDAEIMSGVDPEKPSEFYEAFKKALPSERWTLYLGGSQTYREFGGQWYITSESLPDLDGIAWRTPRSEFLKRVITLIETQPSTK